MTQHLKIYDKNISIYKEKLIILFGDKQNELSIKDIRQSIYLPTLKKISYEMRLKSLILLNQQHTSIGFCIDRHTSQFKIKEQIGDFLITNLKNCGLAVLTADCLPIILYDIKKSIIGIVHAGWRGTSAGICLKAITEMKNKYGSIAQDINVLYGACAKSCCYEVSKDFYKHFKLYEYWQKSFIKRNNKIYFDNKQFITLQIQTIGIKLENIYDKQTMCTICSFDQCSFRREKEHAGRQITVVSLL